MTTARQDIAQRSCMSCRIEEPTPSGRGQQGAPRYIGGALPHDAPIVFRAHRPSSPFSKALKTVLKSLDVCNRGLGGGSFSYTDGRTSLTISALFRGARHACPLQRVTYGNTDHSIHRLSLAILRRMDTYRAVTSFCMKEME